MWKILSSDSYLKHPSNADDTLAYDELKEVTRKSLKDCMDDMDKPEELTPEQILAEAERVAELKSDEDEKEEIIIKTKPWY